MTPAEFKALKPQFSAVADSVIERYLALAAEQVDSSWEIYEDMGQAAYACHLMTLDGLGSDDVSKSFLSGQSEFQTIKSADVTLVRFQKQANGTEYSDWLNSTPCGRAYHSFVRRRIGNGVFVAMASGGMIHGTSGYAKDAPIFSWGGYSRA